MIAISEQEQGLWDLGRRDGFDGVEKFELSREYIVYRDGWRHGVLQRITRNMNQEEKNA